MFIGDFIVLLATFSGNLSSNSGRFSRPKGSGSNYFYQAIQVTVYTYGGYTFTSNSTMHPCSCFYEFFFDPSYPTRNLMRCDDNSDDTGQFRFSINIAPSERYIMVVTTHSSSITGNFSIIAMRLTPVYMVPLRPITRESLYF